MVSTLKIGIIGDRDDQRASQVGAPHPLVLAFIQAAKFAS